MSNALAVVPQGGEDYTEEKVALIKRMLCAGATDDELQLFLYTARRTGLDPLARQIHMVKRWNSAAKREVASIQTGIDGYRLIADRTGKLAGIGDAEFDVETADHPGKATVTVRKIVDGTVQEFTASARWNEYVQMYKPQGQDKMKCSPMWEKMPYLMLGKCAEALALRKAFPADLSGVYTFEEMGQADNDTRPTAAPSQTTQRQAQPDVQRRSQKAALPPMGAAKTQKTASDPVICSECRIKDGHAADCKYATQKPVEGAAEHGDAYEGPDDAPVEKTKEEKFAEREKAWLAYAGHDPAKHISFKQAGLLFTIQGKVGITEEQMKEYMATNLKVEHRPHILKEHFTPLLDALDPNFEYHKAQG